jgi:fructose 1,6-bisphosphate aldolase/phosphatase
MRLTLSVIKADVGSIGGHTRPSEEMMAAAREDVRRAVESGLLLDGFVSHTGDDIALLMSHTRGSDDSGIHQFAWDSFLRATEIAQRSGLYGAGQDLLVDAPSGNLRGAGPAVGEIELDHSPAKTNSARPAETFCLFAADKCGPGAYNLPLFLAFADPMHCAGLMLPKMIDGFRFRIIDMECTEGDRVLELDAPEDYYRIAVLLRDNERFAIEAIHSRSHPDQKAAAVSAQRLHNIAGTYTGKDDPIALVRTQGIFPAPEELLSPFAKAHFVGGDARGSHVMPLMPVPINTTVAGLYCIPLISCLGFSVDASGLFSAEPVDFFDNPAWDLVRTRAQEKTLAIRDQGWSGAAMLPYSELEYGGFRDTVTELLDRFTLEDGRAPRASAAVAAADDPKRSRMDMDPD